jgi:diacylglycerol kinase family enzyme
VLLSVGLGLFLSGTGSVVLIPIVVAFALDLGVDREDVVGALDAFFDGGERYVDLGEVNGRVFVNNVSLGVYGEAGSQGRYREAKLRTRQLAAPELEIEADSPLPIGVDGESLLLEPPLRFRVRPRALRVRIASSYSGSQ